jgi:hypothetical protein
MDGRNCRLQRVGSAATGSKCARDECGAFADQLAIPERAILIGEQNDLARRRCTRRAPGFVQQHQRQQADGFGLRQQGDKQSAKADRLRGEVDARERFARRRRIAFVEHEIDHAQHAVEALGQLIGIGHLVRNARVANLGLRAHDTLRKRWRSAQKSLGDLLGRQSAHFAQRQRHLRVGRERRMATREDQPQAIVFDALVGAERRIVGNRFDHLGHVLDRVEARAPADSVDCLEASRGHEPGAGIRRHAFARPLLQSRAECVVQRFLGNVEVAEQADERREHAPRLGAIDRVDGPANLLDRPRAHRVSLACINPARYLHSLTHLAGWLRQTARRSGQDERGQVCALVSVA